VLEAVVYGGYNQKKDFIYDALRYYAVSNGMTLGGDNFLPTPAQTALPISTSRARQQWEKTLEDVADLASRLIPVSPEKQRRSSRRGSIERPDP